MHHFLINILPLALDLSVVLNRNHLFLSHSVCGDFRPSSFRFESLPEFVMRQTLL
jgi:hypothetical protein